MTVVLLHGYSAPPSGARTQIHFFFLPPLAPLPPALAASAFLFPRTASNPTTPSTVTSTTPAKGEISPEEVAVAASSANAGKATRAPVIAAFTAAATFAAGRVFSALMTGALLSAAIALQTEAVRDLARGPAPRESAGETMGAANARTDIFRIERALPGVVRCAWRWNARALFGGELFPATGLA